MLLDMLVFLREHGEKAYIKPGYSSIFALDRFTFRDATGRVQRGEEWVELAPNWKAIKTWLGY